MCEGHFYNEHDFALGPKFPSFGYIYQRLLDYNGVMPLDPDVGTIYISDVYPINQDNDIEVPLQWLWTTFNPPSILPFNDCRNRRYLLLPFDFIDQLELNINPHHPLLQRPQNNGTTLRRVIYSARGNRMRGCRCYFPSDAIPGREVCFRICDTPQKAAYLVALLNAPVLTNAFNNSRPTETYFGLHPWREGGIRIPRYDPANDPYGYQQKLSCLTRSAECSVRNFLGNLRHNLNEGQNLPGQGELSNQIREHLYENGIIARINYAARQILDL